MIKKHPKGLAILIADGGTTSKSLLEQFNFILKRFFIPTTIVITLDTEWLRKAKFYK